MQGPETYSGTELVDLIGLDELPRTNSAIAGVIQPLRPVELGSALIHCNPILQVRSVPTRNAVGRLQLAEHAQRLPLKRRISNGVLHDKPSRFGPLLTHDTLVRPTVRREQVPQPRSVAGMHRFHTRKIWTAQFASLFQLSPDAEILSTHIQKFTPQFLFHRYESSLQHLKLRARILLLGEASGEIYDHRRHADQCAAGRAWVTEILRNANFLLSAVEKWRRRRVLNCGVAAEEP